MIHETAIVSPLATVATDARIWHWTHVREFATVGSGASIGQCCYIDHHVAIGPGCRVQNGVNLYFGVTLDEGVFVGPNATFTNDRRPRAALGSWDPERPDLTRVSAHASIGAGAVILPVTIGTGAMIGAGAVVRYDVAERAVMRGNPARQVGVVCWCGLMIHPCRPPRELAHCLRCDHDFSDDDFSGVVPLSEPWRP